MRRLLTMLLAVSILVIACQSVTVNWTSSPTPPASPTAEPVTAAPPSETPTAAVPTTTSTPTASPTITPTLAPLPDDPFLVRIHPDGGTFVGDQISFEIIAPEGAYLDRRTARVELGQPGTLIGSGEFSGYGISDRSQATLTWIWDTQALEPGDYTLSYSINPDGPSWTETVSLQPQSAMTPPEPDAAWASLESDCCIFHYVTGTPAERDLPALVEAAEQQAESTSRLLDEEFAEPVTVVFLPRVLGHGGFANEVLSISYLDQNYAGNDVDTVLHHEMVHKLDGQLGGELRPSMLVEGLAVYLSGGHFKTEPLIPRAAALLDLDWYLPLTPLADDFYTSQHEIGYLEAGALVAYMVERWGWGSFNAFYRDIHPVEGAGQAEAISDALSRHFGLTLADLEADFLQHLSAQPVDPQWREDVRQSVNFYDAVRRYQQALDPSAHYLTAWLVDFQAMLERGIVADYLRHPSEPENQAIESLLVAADRHLRAGEYPQVQRYLEMVNAALQVVESRQGD